MSYMKPIADLDDEMLEAPGRCDYDENDERCIASATRLIVVRTEVMIARTPVFVEFLSCDDHREATRAELANLNLIVDSEHAFEHQCAAVFASDRGETTVFRCDCGAIVGVE